MATYNPLANALKITFDSWCKKNKKYEKLYLALPKEIVEGVVWSALEELTHYNPTVYHVWWQLQHTRFNRKFKQVHLGIVHELMFVFLSALAKGKINAKEEQNKTTEKTARPSKKQNTNSKAPRREATEIGAALFAPGN